MESVTASRQQLHRMVDELSEAHAEAVLAFAQVLTMDPVSRAILFAAYDDEPVTVDEDAEIERARHEPRVGLTFDELLSL